MNSYYARYSLLLLGAMFMASSNMKVFAERHEAGGSIVDANSLLLNPQSSLNRDIVFTDILEYPPDGAPRRIDRKLFLPMQLKNAGTAWVPQDAVESFQSISTGEVLEFSGTVLHFARRYYVVVDGFVGDSVTDELPDAWLSANGESLHANDGEESNAHEDRATPPSGEGGASRMDDQTEIAAVLPKEADDELEGLLAEMEEESIDSIDPSSDNTLDVENALWPSEVQSIAEPSIPDALPQFPSAEPSSPEPFEDIWASAESPNEFLAPQPTPEPIANTLPFDEGTVAALDVGASIDIGPAATDPLVIAGHAEEEHPAHISNELGESAAIAETIDVRPIDMGNEEISAGMANTPGTNDQQNLQTTPKLEEAVLSPADTNQPSVKKVKAKAKAKKPPKKAKSRPVVESADGPKPEEDDSEALAQGFVASDEIPAVIMDNTGVEMAAGELTAHLATSVPADAMLADDGADESSALSSTDTPAAQSTGMDVIAAPDSSSISDHSNDLGEIEMIASGNDEAVQANVSDAERISADDVPDLVFPEGPIMPPQLVANDEIAPSYKLDAVSNAIPPQYIDAEENARQRESIQMERKEAKKLAVEARARERLAAKQAKIEAAVLAKSLAEENRRKAAEAKAREIEARREAVRAAQAEANAKKQAAQEERDRSETVARLAREEAARLSEIEKQAAAADRSAKLLAIREEKARIKEEARRVAEEKERVSEEERRKRLEAKQLAASKKRAEIEEIKRNQELLRHQRILAQYEAKRIESESRLAQELAAKEEAFRMALEIQESARIAALEAATRLENENNKLATGQQRISDVELEISGIESILSADREPTQISPGVEASATTSIPNASLVENPVFIGEVESGLDIEDEAIRKATDIAEHAKRIADEAQLRIALEERKRKEAEQLIQAMEMELRDSQVNPGDVLAEPSGPNTDKNVEKPAPTDLPEWLQPVGY